MNEAIPDRIRDGALKLLAGVYLELCLLCDCLDIVIYNGNFSKKYKKIIREILFEINIIKSDIGQTVNRISEVIAD